MKKIFSLSIIFSFILSVALFNHEGLAEDKPQANFEQLKGLWRLENTESPYDDHAYLDIDENGLYMGYNESKELENKGYLVFNESNRMYYLFDAEVDSTKDKLDYITYFYFPGNDMGDMIIFPRNQGDRRYYKDK